MKLLQFLLAGSVLLPRAYEAKQNIKIYEQYLLKFDKSILRLNDTTRVALFFESLLYVYNFKIENSASSHSVELNEMSDWSENEIKARFPITIMTDFDHDNGHDSAGIDLSPTTRATITTARINSENYQINNQINNQNIRTEYLSSAVQLKSIQSSKNQINPTSIPKSIQSILDIVPQKQINSNNVLNIVPKNILHIVPQNVPEIIPDSLNWASTSNPKNKAVISTVRNQVQVVYVLKL